jgi:2-dehydro-3-deoxygluconokinase
MSRIQPDDFPSDLIMNSPPGIFHTTGITCGISASAAKTALHAACLAKKAGSRFSFDLNYRVKLWKPDAAKDGCQPLMELADIIFLRIRDAKTIYNYSEEKAEAVLELLARQFPQATIVLTMGATGDAARTNSGRYWFQSALAAEEVERLGGGDAFSAGFLYGLLKSEDVQLALRWGAAVAALKYTIPSDFPLFHFEEAETPVMGRSSNGIVR